jgi:hypothetical protein
VAVRVLAAPRRAAPTDPERGGGVAPPKFRPCRVLQVCVGGIVYCRASDFKEKWQKFGKTRNAFRGPCSGGWELCPLGDEAAVVLQCSRSGRTRRRRRPTTRGSGRTPLAAGASPCRSGPGEQLPQQVAQLPLLDGRKARPQGKRGRRWARGGGWTVPVSSMLLLLLVCRGAGTSAPVRATRPRRW